MQYIQEKFLIKSRRKTHEATVCLNPEVLNITCAAGLRTVTELTLIDAYLCNHT